MPLQISNLHLTLYIVTNALLGLSPIRIEKDAIDELNSPQVFHQNVVSDFMWNQIDLV